MTAPRDYILFDLPGEERHQLLQAARHELERHPEVLFAYAHGSFLGSGPFRDLDLAVHLDVVPTEPPLFIVEDDLAEAVRAVLATAIPVDLRITNIAPLTFQFRAFCGQLLVDRDADRRAAILAWVAERYFDLQPVLRHYAKEAFSHAP